MARGCCCERSGPGAGLSVETDPDSSALRPGRRRGQQRARSGRAACAAPGPAGTGREPTGRERQHRHASSGAGRARCYTLLLAYDGTMVINPHVFPKIPFDTLGDFAPVTKLGDATLILVAHPSAGVRTLDDLIQHARKKPFAYGTSGTGNTTHLAAELLKQRTGAQLEHVPYKGGGPAVVDVLGGQIPLVFTAIATAQQYVRSGRLVALGVPSAKRSAALPDVPAFAESGLPGFDVTSWVGIVAPAKTPAPIVLRLQKEIAAVLQTQFVRDRYATLGIEPVGNLPAEFGEQIRADLERWEKVVKAANIRVE